MTAEIKTGKRRLMLERFEEPCSCPCDCDRRERSHGGCRCCTSTPALSNWYLGSARHVEVFELSNGQQLLDTQVQALIQAMASFSPPAAGQTSLPQNYQDSLNGV